MDNPNMEIVFLGTSAGVPTRERNVTSIAIKRGPELLLFDVGDGTQRQLIKAGVGLRVKTRIFITHMHGDHIVGLLALLQTYSLMGRAEPLQIIGPGGVEEFVKRNLEMLNVYIGFPLNIGVLHNGPVLETDEYVVKALKTIHSVETYALSLEEKPRPGRFNPEKARELGIPVPYWRDLKAGKRVVIKDMDIDPSLVVSPPRRGRKVVFSSDTSPFEGLVEFAKGADVLIHDSTYGEAHLDKARKNLHSAARDAAEVALKADVRFLILTHFSARYSDVEELAAEAREVFPYVIAAEDFFRMEVPYPD